MTAEPERPTLLTSCRQRTEADNIAAALRDRGIWCFVRGFIPGSPLRGASAELYCELFVKERDWSAAAEIAIEYRTGGDGRDHRVLLCTACGYPTKGLHAVPKCPECGADLVEQARKAILANQETIALSASLTISDDELAAQAETFAPETQVRTPKASPRRRPHGWKLAMVFGAVMTLCGCTALWWFTRPNASRAPNDIAFAIVLVILGIIILRVTCLSARKS
jgi:hypothetical protein